MITTQIKKRRAHEGLVEDIRRQIEAGALSPGNYLLPERALVTKYNVSSRAVRIGLAHLEAEGLISRHQGRGTVVRQRESKTSSRQLDNVAVIYQGRVNDASTAEEFDSLQQALQREGYGTTLYVADYSPDNEAQIVNKLVDAGVPGLVLFSAHAPKSFAHLQAAREAGMKIVAYNHDFPDLDCNFVGIDDRLAALEATEHLVNLGCRQLLFINSEQERTDHLLRQQGFEEAARKSGLPSRILRVPHQEALADRANRIRRELATLSESAQRPLGIVAWWDAPAVMTMDCLREIGWSVPQDARVVGIGDDGIGQSAPIPLTTMSIPRAEIARLSAMLLVNQMQNPQRPSQRIRLQARMIIRKSCGIYEARFAGAQPNSESKAIDGG